MKYINIEHIHTLLSLPVETCGYVTEGIGEEMIPVVDGVPQANNNKASCEYNPPYKSILWHTHAYTMKSYPSTEDILKALKLRSNKNAVLDSLIFTSWGIWEFSAKNKGPVNKEIVHMLNQIFSGLYHVTEKGRSKLNAVTLQFLQGYIEQLKYMLSAYNFDMHFTHWEHLKNNNVYYLRN